MTDDDACESRESKYVPWSFGEVFECTVCGKRVIQPHTTRPIEPASSRDYGTLYPIAAHERKISAGVSR